MAVLRIVLDVIRKFSTFITDGSGQAIIRLVRRVKSFVTKFCSENALLKGKRCGFLVDSPIDSPIDSLLIREMTYIFTGECHSPNEDLFGCCVRLL